MDVSPAMSKVGEKVLPLMEGGGLDIVVDALRDLSETHKRAPWVSSQHGKHIINNDAWLSQRIPLAHRDLPRTAYKR